MDGEVALAVVSVFIISCLIIGIILIIKLFFDLVI